MPKIHYSRSELKDRYEKLKRRRLLPGNILFVILTVISFAALLYWLFRPEALENVVDNFFGFLLPDDGFLSDLLWLLSLPVRDLIRYGIYVLLIYIIGLCVYKLYTQDHGSVTDEEVILELAVKGEERILSALSRLPEWCHIYTNITIPWKDQNGKPKSSHTDLILVSPVQIMAIKIKNLKGDICGNISDQNLIQEIYHHARFFKQKPFTILPDRCAPMGRRCLII